MDYYYPNIEIIEDNDVIRLKTIIRIKEDGVWYDVPVRRDYEGTLIFRCEQRFKDDLILTKYYWHASLHLGLTPSANQDDTTDDLLDDKERLQQLLDYTQALS